MNYYDAAKKFEVLSKEEQTTLAIQTKSGDNQAREKLIKHNLRLVLFMARKYRKRFPWISFEDLIGVGNIALLQAIENYNPSGIAFGSYAFIYIKGMLTQYINSSNSNGLTRIATRIDRKLLRFNKDVSYILQEKNLDIKEELINDLAKKSKVSVVGIKKHLANKQIHTVSIDNTISDGDTYHDIIKDINTINMEEAIHKKQLLTECNVRLSRLSDKDKDVLFRVLQGKDLKKNKGYSEVARELNLSRERVRQIYTKSLIKIGAQELQ